MKKPWLALIVGATTLACFAQEPETTLKVDVKLVNVFVTVTDSRGGPIASLQKENFLLKEDGKEQRIAIFSRESALPLSIVLAIDTSLSTKKDLPLEQAAAHKFAHTILRPQDGLAVYKFSGRDTGGEHALIQFSEDTGGKYYYASSLAQLDEAFRKISDELRMQYLLAYYPSQHYSESEFRRIKIDLTNPPPGGPYQARYRAGYYTSKDSF